MQQPILTTEKDAVRLATYALAQCHTIAIGVRFLDNEGAFLEVVRAALAVERS
jgi:tetraacyldisaccharide-1-P 4'-kinase